MHSQYCIGSFLSLSLNIFILRTQSYHMVSYYQGHLQTNHYRYLCKQLLIGWGCIHLPQYPKHWYLVDHGVVSTESHQEFHQYWYKSNSQIYLFFLHKLSQGIYNDWSWTCASSITGQLRYFKNPDGTTAWFSPSQNQAVVPSGFLKYLSCPVKASAEPVQVPSSAISVQSKLIQALMEGKMNLVLAPLATFSSQ